MTTLMDRSARSSATAKRKQPNLPKLPKDRRQSSGFFRRFFIASSLFLLLMVITGVIAVWIAWVSVPLPPDVPLAQTTVVTDANGKQLAAFSAGQNREPVKLGDVPPVVLQAIIDTEDHNYYSHHGVDPRGTARALYTDLRAGSAVEGGSTITQQYVKQTYDVGKQRNVWLKFKEAILAVKVDQRLSKDQVLERYVNTIYWGRGAYGIQTASHDYFNKDVNKLGLQEASYLAGLIKGPELADAYKDPNTAASRRERTLASMVRYGTITPDQQAQTNAVPLKNYVIAKAPAVPAAAASSANGAQYFVEYVKNILIQRYGEKLVESGGLKVKTTLDADMQNGAYNSIYGFLKPGEPAGALVSLDSNGYVKAMVGGRDYATSQVNLATGTAGGGSGRQAGSTFKAFELASAVEAGACYNDRYSAPGKIVIPGWGTTTNEIDNFDNESFAGKIDLLQATAESVNTVYAQLVMEYGVSNLIDEAKKAGITSKLDANNSLVLGVDSVSPLEMADAYLTFSQGGVHVDPNPILEVKNADNQTLERAQPKRTRVMDAETANVVNKALQGVVEHGTGTKAQVSGQTIAGKTGTTEDNGDAWFVGYTPSMATSVWMGYPEGSNHKMDNVRGIPVTGGTFPAQMWQSYMKKATAGVKNQGFTQPKNCTSSSVDTTTSSTSTSTSLFPKNTTTTLSQDQLQDLNRQIDSRGGRSRGITTTTEERALDVSTTVPGEPDTSTTQPNRQRTTDPTVRLF